MFGLEENLCVYVHRYDARLNEAKLLGAKKGFSVGTALFFTFFFIFIVDAVAFWFGGYLISEGLSEGGDVLTVSVLIVALLRGTLTVTLFERCPYL